MSDDATNEADDVSESGRGDDEAGAVDTALRLLVEPTPAAGRWTAPDSVRRVARTRRRRRALGVGAVVVLAAAGTVALSVEPRSGGGHGSTGRPPIVADATVRTASRLPGALELVADHVPVAASDPGATASVVRSEQALAIRALQVIGGSGNISTSPLSLYVALAMLRNGAAGQTEQQIAAALQSGDLSVATQDAGVAGLTAALDAAAAKDSVTLQSANSVWQQNGFPITTQFLADLATYFHTGVWRTDFMTPAAVQAINAWTSAHTHRKITKLFDELDPSTVLVLANAVYFHATWATPFPAALTEPGTFTTATGKKVQTKFMSGGPGLQTKVTSDYDAVQLPYQGGRFAALAVMPRTGSLTDFVAGLTPTRLAQFTTGMTTGKEGVDIPRFTTTTKTDLTAPLKKLGMTDAFDDRADFSNLSSQPTSVSQAIQRVYLAVSEKGTTAAAVTGIASALTSARGFPDPLRLDHPFLFLIRDTTTGAIVFASQITDPTAG